MRRRIALFANGWGTECLLEVGLGIKRVAAVNDIDIFAFINYAAHADIETNKLGDFNVFTIPSINDFDGAIVLANSFNSDYEFEFTKNVICKSSIPVIAVESRLDGMDYFGSDDYEGMREVTEHLIVEHGVKDIVYIGGIPGHEGDTIRQKAVIETAKKHGISIPDDNILHGSFAAAEAILCLTEWRKNHTLPEAIICANDIMAMGICNVLKEENIRIPEDIIVTGFDCLKAAGEYEPSITSVNRDWVLLGTKVMEKLLKKMDGETVSSEEVLDTRMIKGCSCGCILDEGGVNTWKSLRTKNQNRDINGFKVDQHVRHMFLAMRKVASIEDMSNSLAYYFQHENWYEGDNIMIALCPGFFAYSDDETSKKITYGYPDEMDAACFVCNGKKIEHHRSKTSSVIFEAANRNQNPSVYLFAPLRSDNEMFGFVMTSDSFEIVKNDILYIWTKHMGQYLEQVKSNVAINHLTKQLEMLSITDKLTGVYNRAGCETVMYSKLNECQHKGGMSVILLADLDRLKKINDVFGHSSGDAAITTTIDLLKKNLSDDYMIGRFGGDEFLIASPQYNKIDVEQLTNNLMDAISKDPVTKEFTFKLSVSIGGIQLESGKCFDIQEHLPVLDEIMYKNKEAHHKTDENK